MKRFEIYVAKFPYESETGTYIIILGNGIVYNAIFCAPIMFEKNDNNKNRFHIQVNTKKEEWYYNCGTYEEFRNKQNKWNS